MADERPPHEQSRPLQSPSTRMPEALAARAVAAVLGPALWLMAGQIDRPLAYDDISFLLSARAIADAGVPYGNQG